MQSSATPTVNPKILDVENLRVPEILAPAGGREQFFAALGSGADAVFLGLKQFNARGRAENFTLDDLKELAPLARRHGMKILVTLNILLKESELPRLRLELAELQWIGIHAVIVQDLGVARFIRKNFPSLRLHASTQLAVHNLAGVLAAIDFGFKRVVVARELTAQELRRIQTAVEGLDVEIEAFCHGSLCYSYSGLCFFSGAEDARSGNRGECAYTCRKPYRILNEPGHGFLFSMKDLNTSKDLGKLVEANIHTLKIEGRKKDAQYVATSVGLYRQELNRIFGRETAPGGRSIVRDYQSDMSFSFHRDMTSLFVNGRYHENVIDLNNPTHKGVLIGQIEKVRDRTIELLSTVPLERFDGLRIDSTEALFHSQPQHGEKVQGSLRGAQNKYRNNVSQFSLRDFAIRGRRMNETNANTRVEIELPAEIELPKVGDKVYKIRSNELKRHTENLSKAPADARLRPLLSIDLSFHAIREGENLQLSVAATLAGTHILTENLVLDYQTAKKPNLAADILDNFTILGDAACDCRVSFQGDGEAFVPRSVLKDLKQKLNAALPEAIQRVKDESIQASLDTLTHNRHVLPAAHKAAFAVKIDRLEYLESIVEFAAHNPDFALSEIIFEPKRAFLGKLSPKEVFQTLFEKRSGANIRFAFPTVLRAWDEPLLKAWVIAYKEAGGSLYEIGNVGARKLLDSYLPGEAVDLSSDFSLYILNTEAALATKDLGVSTVALSIEDDSQSLKEKLVNWPVGELKPQVILYKDTPLFIAEACSLTALHNGCPTAAVCGYRTLEIENDEGERFFVAHESCKSIVFGAKAYAISQHRGELMKQGVSDFRIDFLTREYTAQHLQSVLSDLHAARIPSETHSANFERILL
ncbi:MAG: U32 family peptidase [Proteobacteria bacterium]|nr:MAG: U32 family peptidase [Pseudomonadota bacterium]